MTRRRRRTFWRRERREGGRAGDRGEQERELRSRTEGKKGNERIQNKLEKARKK